MPPLSWRRSFRSSPDRSSPSPPTTASTPGTALILATGMKRRTLGLPGEERLSGVSYCAVCDGAFYAGRDVAVVGGGSAALQDALFLADTCRTVTVIHRRAQFRGTRCWQMPCGPGTT